MRATVPIAILLVRDLELYKTLCDSPFVKALPFPTPETLSVKSEEKTESESKSGSNAKLQRANRVIQAAKRSIDDLKVRSVASAYI